MGQQRAAGPEDGRDSQRRLVDFAGAVFFLLLQAAVFRATLFLLAGRSIDFLFYGGLALLTISLALVIWRLARTRSAAVVALTGLVLQFGLSGLAFLSTS
ncbi:MAG: hypothetical protein U1C73_22295 [Dietzia sp.]|nr:hypothetical protein [Dietzia sp.]